MFNIKQNIVCQKFTQKKNELVYFEDIYWHQWSIYQKKQYLYYNLNYNFVNYLHVITWMKWICAGFIYHFFIYNVYVLPWEMQLSKGEDWGPTNYFISATIMFVNILSVLLFNHATRWSFPAAISLDISQSTFDGSVGIPLTTCISDIALSHWPRVLLM